MRYTSDLQARLVVGIERSAHMLAERLAPLERGIVPAAIFDLALVDVEVDAIRGEARDGAHRDVIVAREEQPLLESDVVGAGVRALDCAQLIAVHVKDVCIVTDTLTSTARISTPRGWIVTPHLIVAVVHSRNPFLA